MAPTAPMGTRYAAITTVCTMRYTYDREFANVVHLCRQPTQVGVRATWLRSALGSS